ncbi:MAG: hypothetical protein JWP82_1367, partial [Humibacillus sp.]|nr:hypothetical protein [Humibacillus sp.]
MTRMGHKSDTMVLMSHLSVVPPGDEVPEGPT